MLKFLIITTLVIFILARFAGYFFRLVFWLLGKKVQKEFKKQQENGNFEYYTNGATDTSMEGEIRIIPTKVDPSKDDVKKRFNQGKKGFNDGEYVDFEEVK